MSALATALIVVICLIVLCVVLCWVCDQHHSDDPDALAPRSNHRFVVVRSRPLGSDPLWLNIFTRKSGIPGASTLFGTGQKRTFRRVLSHPEPVIQDQNDPENPSMDYQDSSTLL